MKPSEGWAAPPSAQRWHYFIGPRSLCYRWKRPTFLALDFEPNHPNRNHTHDCARCLKLLNSTKPEEHPQ